MKWLKLAAAVVLLIVAIVAVSRFNSCMNNWRGIGKTSTDTPKDSSFMPIEHRHYQPPSLPGLTNLVGIPPTAPAKLPKGVSEKDVKRVLTLNVRELSKPINVIEMKDDRVFVEKDSGLVSVGVTDYVPPIVQFGFYPGVGISIGKVGTSAPTFPMRFSPLATVAVADWWGLVRVPCIAADLDGIGISASAKIYYDFYIGVAMLWKYEDTSQRVLKATIAYNFN
jgi:hypothetical protein